VITVVNNKNFGEIKMNKQLKIQKKVKIEIKKYLDMLKSEKQNLVERIEELSSEIVLCRKEEWGAAHANYIRSNYSDKDKQNLIEVEEKLDSLILKLDRLENELENFDINKKLKKEEEYLYDYYKYA
jgi:hypothetical protein